jgi:SET domain-containing protein
MMMVETALKESPISGIGTFAVDVIPKGTLVWQLDERFYVLVREEEIPTFPPIIQRLIAKYGYPHLVREGVICCDIDNGRFMNHSDRANTDFTDPRQAWAIRDIRPGEEITCNYREFIPGFKGFDSR